MGVILVLHAAAAEHTDQWRNLQKVDKSNAYTFAFRDKSCALDRIRDVLPDRLVLASGRTLPRADVLFVGQGTNAHQVLYAGRSSWDAVKQVNAVPPEKLSLRLKSGEEVIGSEAGASDTELAIKRSGRIRTLPKDDIEQVEYIRFKPLSEVHTYYLQEAAYLGIFDPKVWQYWLRIDAFISVRIYDATLPEDNLQLECHSNPSNH